MHEFFTFKGRLRRRAFWSRLLGLYAGMLAVYAGLDQLAVHYTTAEAWVELLSILCLLGTVGLVSIQTVKRLHDTNLTGWWWWLLLVPVVGNFFGLGISFVDGTSGANRFGSDPKGRLSLMPLASDADASTQLDEY